MLAGKSMIERTWRQCVQGFPRERVWVATEDERIRAHCEALGIPVLMTSPDCLTGTDRVAEVAQRLPAAVYLNVQGDEPLCNPEDIRAILDASRRYPGEIINGYCALDEERAFRSPSTPKVVFRPDGRLLYMSRAAIPSDKSLAFCQAWRQVCIYAFPARALGEFAARGAKTPLESLEDIEILRFLEMGYEVRMVPLSAESIAVDTPEDVIRVEQRLSPSRGQGGGHLGGHFGGA